MKRRSTIAAALLAAAAVALSSGVAPAQGRPGPVATHAPAAALQVAPRDPWTGTDKALHLGVSAALAGAGYGLGAAATDAAPGRLAIGAALALGAGAAKEALDAGLGAQGAPSWGARPGAPSVGRWLGTPSWRDLLWDAVGSAFGLALALSVDVAARPAAFGSQR
ncbi:MAG: hypothetical protein IT372_18920 [Polyangiaceae bacterium]|nr:hypothetical protein [Polyangiaceae bacterium]